MNQPKRALRGFTLMELMITMVIIAILTAIAIPSYQSYTKRAYFTEIVMATAPFTTSVGVCYENLGALSGCSGGKNGVQADLGTVGGIASITTVNGVITATPAEVHGIKAGDTYVLTPTVGAGGVLTWAVSGGAVAAGLVK